MMLSAWSHDKGDSIIYRILLSRAFSGLSFSFLTCMEVGTLGEGEHPLMIAVNQRGYSRNLY